MDKGIFMKHIVLLSMVIAMILFFVPNSFATDSPHADTDVPSVDCSDCHTGHAAPGPSLTDDADNANLCMSCHTAGGLANNKRLSVAMQADTAGGTGTSHRWDTSMATDAEGGSLGLVAGNPNNKHGLVPCDASDCTAITNATLKLRLQIYNYKVTCSVCHNQHKQALAPWDPFASATPGDAGRKFMRMVNDDLNELCVECHQYRHAGAQTDVRTWDGNKKSHPVGKIFTSDQAETPDVTDTTQFNTAPVEPASAGWAKQTGVRYRDNAGGDANLTNNIIVNANYEIRCLSCHGIHYTDSDSSTVDGP